MITQKQLKTQSRSEWATIMRIVNNKLDSLPIVDDGKLNIDVKNQINADIDYIQNMLNKVVDQLVNEEKIIKNNLQEQVEITDCAIHAPRDCNTKIRKMKPIRLAYYCAKRMYLDTSRMEKLEWALMHWQRLLSTLSRAFIEQEKKKAILADEFKTARLMQHQRTGWCLLKKKEIAVPVGRPTAMSVEISPLEELQPFFNHLANDGSIRNNQVIGNNNYLKFERGVVYPDGRMDLCKQVVGDKWIGNLMEALKTNTQIEHFLLGNNVTKLEGGKAIGEYLVSQHPNKIKTWYLAGSEFNSKALEYIVNGFLTSRDNDVKALWLKRNPLYAEGMIYIRQLLEHNNSIKVLDLHNTAIGLREDAYNNLVFTSLTNNGIELKMSKMPYENYLTDNGIMNLCEGLKVNDVLENLYLDANGLQISSLQYLAEYFSFKTKMGLVGIKNLWIGMNKLTDDGVKILCKSLKDYPIRGLELGSVYMSDVGMEYIANTFKNHSSLEVLDLGLYKATADMGAVSNNIGDNGVKWICDLIENNSRLKYLDISMNNISADGIDKIANSLEKNKNIWYIYYKQYGHEVKQKTILKIENILFRNHQLANSVVNNSIVFDKEYKRRLVHGEDIWTIDSIYRNNMK